LPGYCNGDSYSDCHSNGYGYCDSNGYGYCYWYWDWNGDRYGDGNWNGDRYGDGNWNGDRYGDGNWNGDYWVCWLLCSTHRLENVDWFIFQHYYKLKSKIIFDSNAQDSYSCSTCIILQSFPLSCPRTSYIENIFRFK
jgi:hypothetical protein